MENHLKQGRAREKTVTKIRVARYDAERDAIVVELSTGVSLIASRARIPGFQVATCGQLADLAIEPSGETLWSESLDEDVLLEQLVVLAMVSARWKRSLRRPRRLSGA
jgi:hypothetical protein